jgi:hypothetical protein
VQPAFLRSVGTNNVPARGAQSATKATVAPQLKRVGTGVPFSTTQTNTKKSGGDDDDNDDDDAVSPHGLTVDVSDNSGNGGGQRWQSSTSPPHAGLRKRRTSAHAVHGTR